MLDPEFAAGGFDQDAAHRLGRGGEEVPPAVPMPCLVHVHEPNVGFVNQGRGLEGLAGALAEALPESA